MRVLILHNRYRSEGGEERAVNETAALLRSAGHEAVVLERSSELVSRSRAARGMLTGGLEPEAVTRAVSELGAEVVHAHNVHPLFGWRALAAARAAGAATVLHVHNYRLFCSIAVTYRDGHRCLECRGRRTLPAVAHRCRGSLAESAVYAAGLARQQRSLFEHAGVLVAVSGFVAQRIVELGAPAQAVRALPNFVPEAALAARSPGGAGRYALASGRLVPEKGFEIAIAAARTAGIPLVIAGDGPDAARLRELARGGEVTFTGHVSGERLAELRAGAAVALIPSLWDEPFPYAALDAMAAGLPVLASDRGGLPEAVGPDAVLPAGDEAAWARALTALRVDPEAISARGAASLARARELFGAERYLTALLVVYEEAARRL